jgi:phosphoribosyl-ATP pyrophosphohydrolase
VKILNDVLAGLYQTITLRRDEPAENSYTNYLFAQGVDKICKKIGEECAETIIAAKNKDTDALTGEVSDVLYHLLVLLAELGVPWDAVQDEMRRRSEKIGNNKERRDVDKNT